MTMAHLKQSVVAKSNESKITSRCFFGFSHTTAHENKINPVDLIAHIVSISRNALTQFTQNESKYRKY